jgi:hypothetical protein
VSSHCCICPHAALYVSSCCYICVLMLLYMCPHAALSAIYVSSCCLICVLMLLYMCPHAAIYVSSCCYICVLMLLYMCPTAPLTRACAGSSEPVDGGVCASHACESVSRATFGPRSSVPPLSPESDHPHRPLLYPYAGAQSHNPLLLHAPLCW